MPVALLGCWFGGWPSFWLRSEQILHVPLPMWSATVAWAALMAVLMALHTASSIAGARSEEAGRRHAWRERWLSVLAVVLSAIPVVAACLAAYGPRGGSLWAAERYQLILVLLAATVAIGASIAREEQRRAGADAAAR